MVSSRATAIHVDSYTVAASVYIYLFIIDAEDPMIRQISKVAGLQLVRYCYLASDATLARQADRFVAVVMGQSH